MSERTPVETLEDLASLNDDEVLDGYRDGFKGLPCGDNRSRAYWHGWRNGRADAGLAEPDDAQRKLAAEASQQRRARLTKGMEGMTIRRALTTLDKLKIMVRQAVCPDCGERLGALDDCEFDHLHQLAMGGADTIDNLRAKHVDCHKRKTAKDAAARAKVKRITGKTKTRNKADRFAPLPTGADVYEPEPNASVSRGNKRQWPKGQRIPSRPFPTRAKG